jgi:hypothetical protein
MIKRMTWFVTTVLLLICTLSLTMETVHAEVEETYPLNDFTVIDVAGGYKALSSQDNEIEVGTEELTIFIPNYIHNVFQVGDFESAIYSSITFYDESGDEISEHNLRNYIHVFGEQMTISLSGTLEWAYTYSLFILLNTTGVLPSEYVSSMNENSFMVYDDIIKTAVFMNFLQVYWEQTFLNIPEEPPPPSREGMIFNGWRTEDGDIYRFTVIDRSMVDEDGRIMLYAHFTTILDYTPTPGGELDFEGPENIMRILMMFGLYNYPGLLLIYVIAVIFITGGMLALNIPKMAILIVNILLGGFFIYMGYFPLFVTIMFVMVAIVSFFMAIKSSSSPSG